MAPDEPARTVLRSSDDEFSQKAGAPTALSARLFNLEKNAGQAVRAPLPQRVSMNPANKLKSGEFGASAVYRGRIAPSPTGYLHLGHARTFWTAQQRARMHGGTLILRNEDLDSDRCKATYYDALIEDLRWFGFEWNEGPDCGGPHAPYHQSQRQSFYLELFEKLKTGGFLYPCACSRKDIQHALSAPHAGDEEPVYPGTCRAGLQSTADAKRVSWRFRVPDGEVIRFVDGCRGSQEMIAGEHFGDFIVWRHDGIPSYQLAVVADDAGMGITEVVRGADLLVSAARQILLYRALGWNHPAFYHCPLVLDETGQRLAKRHDALSLRALRAKGVTPEAIRECWQDC
jgi:glutamyl/glutaminyl-tRNA synthetase